jgi:hypothetical protein
MGLQIFDEHTPWIDYEPIDSSWGATPLIWTGPAGTRVRIDSMLLTSDDTVDRVVAFWAGNFTAASTLLGCIIVPAGAGTNGVIQPVEAIAKLFPTTLCFFATGVASLYLAPLTGPTAGKFIYLTSMGGLV